MWGRKVSGYQRYCLRMDSDGRYSKRPQPGEQWVNQREEKEEERKKEETVRIRKGEGRSLSLTLCTPKDGLRVRGWERWEEWTRGGVDWHCGSPVDTAACPLRNLRASSPSRTINHLNTISCDRV